MQANANETCLLTPRMHRSRRRCHFPHLLRIHSRQRSPSPPSCQHTCNKRVVTHAVLRSSTVNKKNTVHRELRRNQLCCLEIRIRKSSLAAHPNTALRRMRPSAAVTTRCCFVPEPFRLQATPFASSVRANKQGNARSHTGAVIKARGSAEVCFSSTWATATHKQRPHCTTTTMLSQLWRKGQQQSPTFIALALL
jgi:hypothetical protein